MEPSTHDPPEVLREEILADARKEAGEVISRAQEQANALLERAAAEATRSRQERLCQAQAEAARRTASIMATIAVEAGRVRSTHIEALLNSVREEVKRRLQACDGRDYTEAIIKLAVEAVTRMTGDSFVVKLARADALKFGAVLPQSIISRLKERSLSIAISSDDTVTGGGVIIEDREGHQVWDNRFSSRLERLWPELRRQIAVHTGLVPPTDPQGTAS